MRAVSLLIALSLAVMMVPAAQAVSPDETDPRVIMEAVEGRSLGDRVRSTFEMAIRDGAGRERQRSGEVLTIWDDGARKALLFIKGPPELRNTGLLTYDWNDRAKTDDQWLYMSALSRTTRVTGAGKSGSFLGSDLSFADMTRRNPDDYSYALVKADGEVDGEAVWVIDATPTSEREREETGYTVSRLWISKSKLVPLQVAATLRKGGKVKRMKFFDIREVDGIWTAHRLVIRTERGSKLVSMTIMSWTSVRYDQADVTPALMSTQRLEQGL